MRTLGKPQGSGSSATLNPNCARTVENERLGLWSPSCSLSLMDAPVSANTMRGLITETLTGLADGTRWNVEVGITVGMHGGGGMGHGLVHSRQVHGALAARGRVGFSCGQIVCEVRAFGHAVRLSAHPKREKVGGQRSCNYSNEGMDWMEVVYRDRVFPAACRGRTRWGKTEVRGDGGSCKSKSDGRALRRMEEGPWRRCGELQVQELAGGRALRRMEEVRRCHWPIIFVRNACL